MKKFLTVSLSALALAAALVSCKPKDVPQNADGAQETPSAPNESFKRVAGGYLFNSDQDFPKDSFSIKLNEDGTCTYYETVISSYFGMCRYRVEGDTVIIEDHGIPSEKPLKHTFKFKYENEKLVFIAEGSDRFMFVKLEDGDVFNKVQVVTSEMPNFKPSP